MSYTWWHYIGKGCAKKINQEQTDCVSAIKRNSTDYKARERSSQNEKVALLKWNGKETGCFMLLDAVRVYFSV